MGNGDLISAWPLNKYLMHRSYESVFCELAKTFAEKWRLPFVLSYFSAVVSVVVFFAAIFLVGVPE